MIELLVVVVIVAILIVVAVPLTSSWVDSGRVSEARARLVLGYSQAKALALRNAQKALNGTAAASIVIDSTNSKLYVCEGASANCSSSSASTILKWQSNYPSGVALQYTNTSNVEANLTAIELSSLGLPNLAVSQYKVSKGDQSETFTLQ